MEKYSRKWIDFLATEHKRTVEQELKIEQIKGLVAKIAYFMKDTIPYTSLNWTFANIEQNSSRRREGIRETLFESGVAMFNEKNKQVRPFSAGMLENTKLSRKHIDELAEQSISGAFDVSRYSDLFGVRENNVLIYQPPIDRSELESEYSRFWEIISKPIPFEMVLFSHVVFEKIHPYGDGNGRLGRYILEKLIYEKFKKLEPDLDLPKVWPISYMAVMSGFHYYDIFDIDKFNTCDEIIDYMLFGVVELLKRVCAYCKDLKSIVEAELNTVLQILPKKNTNIWMAKTIICSYMQNKSKFSEKFAIDPKTVKRIFEDLNMMGQINIKSKGSSVFYFSIEIEDLINKHFPQN